MLLLLLAAACGGEKGGSGVSIASPEDGATVQSPFDVSMAAENFTVEPAGDIRDGAGHFHLMVDAACVAAGEQIPADETHIHLVDGAAKTELGLPPGEHSLCLQAGDGRHTALDLVHEITITVVSAGGDAGEVWDGAYEGEVVWDCGSVGTRNGTLAAELTVNVKDGVATMSADHTVTGSCSGPESGSLTTPITVEGTRTADGFTFPATTWGPTGSFDITVTGDHGTDRLAGPAPGPATIALDFDMQCTSGC